MKENGNSRGVLFYTKRVDTGLWVCSRCGCDLYKSKPLCNDCNNEINRLKTAGASQTLGNIKDSFCRTRIKLDGGDIVNIEYNVDNSTKIRLIQEGYGFIFKTQRDYEYQKTILEKNGTNKTEI